MTWTSIYVPAKRESVKRWGLALIIIGYSSVILTLIIQSHLYFNSLVTRENFFKAIHWFGNGFMKWIKGGASWTWSKHTSWYFWSHTHLIKLHATSLIFCNSRLSFPACGLNFEIVITVIIYLLEVHYMNYLIVNILLCKRKFLNHFMKVLQIL